MHTIADRVAGVSKPIATYYSKNFSGGRGCVKKSGCILTKMNMQKLKHAL